MAEEVTSASSTPNGTIGTMLKVRFDEVLNRAMQHALAHAGGAAARRVESVRRLRKATKSIRALLPLLKEAAPEESLAGASSLLADASSLLSPMRDRDAMLGTIERLLGRRVEPRAEQLQRTLISVVSPGDDNGPSREFEDLLVFRASSMLSRLTVSARCFQFARVSSELVCDEIEHARDRARRAARASWIDGCPDDAHALRKDCARLSLQLSFIEELLPKSLRRMRKSLREVTSTLGDEHDLAILAQKLSLERSHLPSEGFVATALELCRRARARLREEAGLAVERAFVVSPRSFREKLLSSFESDDDS